MSNPRKLVAFLFETTGFAVQPFLNKGYDVVSLDLENKTETIFHENGARYIKDNIDLREELTVFEYFKKFRKPEFIFGFPPCTDLAVSGAAHFAKKREKDPEFQNKALSLFLSVERLAVRLKAFHKVEIPYAIENPISVVSSLYRKPDYRFDPCDYGGYLPDGSGHYRDEKGNILPYDEHPEYPEYFPARDAYTKRTCLWVGNGFKIPPKHPVQPISTGDGQNNRTGGRSAKTKRIRSSSPRGFFTALAEVY